MDNSFLIKLGMDTEQIATGVNKSNSLIGGLVKQVGALSIAMASAFSVSAVANFTLEVSKLSGEAKGVSAAFNRLPESTKLMHDLKDATGGTVAELDLMKRSVMASNFDISLQALPQLLEFATLRAQQTGQSVDYLVDSIVTGIGRKSKLILDNLGISAVQLNEALGGTSTAAASIGDVADAVGKIAEENLKNMEKFSDNAATKLQKLEASWKNVKVAIGDAANSTGVLGRTTDLITKTLDVLASKNLSFFEKFAAASGFGSGIDAASQLDRIRTQQQINKEQKEHQQVIQEVDRAYKEFNKDIDAYGRSIQTHVLRTQLLEEFTNRLKSEQSNQVTTLAALNEAIKEQQDLFDQTDINNIKELNQIAQKIAGYQAQIDQIELLKKGQKGERGNLPTLATTRNPGSGTDFLASQGLDDATVSANIYANALMKIVEAYDLMNKSSYDSGNAQKQLWDKSQDDQSAAQQQMQRTASTAISMGNSIGNAIGQAISGNERFADTAKRVTVQIVDTFLQRALAGIIAGAADSGAPPPVAIALAAAGVAAISAMFASIGASRSSSPGLTRITDAGHYSNGSSPGFQVNLGGEFRIRDRDLVLLLNNYNYKTARIG